MAPRVAHRFVSSQPQSTNPNIVSKDEWNDDHELEDVASATELAAVEAAATADLAAHLADTSGAHAGSAISNTPAGTIAATTVQAAIDELASDAAADAQALADHLADTSGAHAASAISNTPAGGIAATTVQAAIDELDTEKQPIDSDLSAIAALTPSNDDVIQRKAGAWANRSMAQLIADLAALGTTFQPLDGDLSAIAALTPSNDDVVQRKGGAWVNRSIAQLLSDLAAPGTTFQPLDSDLTAIAALTTTAYGRALLELANATALTALPDAFTGDTGSGGVKGMVPAPASGDAAANKFLSAGGGWAAVAGSSSGLPAGYIYGLTLSNNTGDATNDIDIAVGKCRDSTDTIDIVFSAAIGKRLDAGWAAGGTPGTTAGGRNSGIAIANTTYHVYAVAKAAGADPDIYLHTSATIATVITALQAESGGGSYIYARRIGSIVRASAAIKAFKQRGDFFEWDVAVADLGLTASIATTAVSRTMTVPTGLTGVIYARINVGARIVQTNTNFYVLITPLDTTDTAASGSAHTAAASASGAGDESYSKNEIDVLVDSSAQVRTRVSLNSGNAFMDIITRGWVDRRGQDGGS